MPSPWVLKIKQVECILFDTLLEIFLITCSIWSFQGYVSSSSESHHGGWINGICSKVGVCMEGRDGLGKF